MDDANHITQEIKTGKETKDLDIYDIGTRHLNDEQIQQLILTLEPIYKFGEPNGTYIHAVTTKLSELLRNENINYEYALNLYAHLHADIKNLQETYTNGSEDDGVTLLDVLKLNIDEKEAKEIQKDILKVVKKPRYEGTINGDIGSDEKVVIDPIEKCVKYVSVNIKNGKDFSKEKTIVEAYPKELTVYQSPLEDEPRKFEVLWDSTLRKRPFKKGPWLMEELVSDLKENGYIIGHRQVNDILPAAINAYIREGKATVKTEIETPGFFYDAKDQKILNIKYEIEYPPQEEIEQALNILEELATWFPEQEVKLATVFKWGLISPFGFARKQIGSWIPWLYMYGQAGSGKTTMGKMALYMWGEPNENNDLGGGSFDTVARVGNRLNQFTFPILINEPAGAFNRVSVVEVFKSAVERTSSRGKYEGRSYRTIPSYAMAMFTANQYLPDDDALIRRLLVLNFTHGESKNDAEKREFEEIFQIENPKNCRLNAFKAITQAISVEIIEDATLLNMDWKELANTLLVRLYADTDKQPPEWLMKWQKSETMEDMDDEHREDVRIFLLNQINQAFGRIQVMDEEYRPKETLISDPNVKNPDHFKSKVWAVVNERLIPWMIPYSTRNGDYVCLTIGFKKALHKELKICQPLKGVAELMGWKYQTVRIPNKTKVVKIKFSKFMEFLYPTGSE